MSGLICYACHSDWIKNTGARLQKVKTSIFTGQHTSRKGGSLVAFSERLSHLGSVVDPDPYGSGSVWIRFIWPDPDPFQTIRIRIRVKVYFFVTLR